MRTRTITLITCIVYICVGGILKDILFPSVPSPEPTPAPESIPTSIAIPTHEAISAPEPIPTLKQIPPSAPVSVPGQTPDSEAILDGSFASANEEQLAPSWESQRRSSPKDHQISWAVIVGLCCSINVLTVLLYLKRVRGENRESETKQQLSEIRMWLEEGDELRQETETRLGAMKEDEDHRHAQFQREMDSMRRVRKVEGEVYAELDPLAMYVKAEGKRSVELQNEADPLAMSMKPEGKDSSKFQNEMDPLAMSLNAEVKRSVELKKVDPLVMFKKAERKRSVELKNEADPLAMFKMAERKRSSKLKNEADPLTMFKKAERKRSAELINEADPLAMFKEA
jgi:hypothetical protein